MSKRNRLTFEYCSSRFLSFILLLFLLFSCSKFPSPNGDPKARLTEYISRSFSINGIEDKANLLTYLSGDMKTRLTSWSDDKFRAAFVDTKRDFSKLVFKEVKEISSTEVAITYELTYLAQGKYQSVREHDAKISNRKLCQMVLEDGKWQIADIRNLKGVLDFKNEMSLP